MLTCPICRSRSIRRSARRNFVERIWSMVGRYPYRCASCQARFFALRDPNRHKESDSQTDQAAESEQPQAGHDEHTD